MLSPKIKKYCYRVFGSTFQRPRSISACLLPLSYLLDSAAACYRLWRSRCEGSKLQCTYCVCISTCHYNVSDYRVLLCNVRRCETCQSIIQTSMQFFSYYTGGEIFFSDHASSDYINPMKHHRCSSGHCYAGFSMLRLQSKQNMQYKSSCDRTCLLHCHVHFAFIDYKQRHVPTIKPDSCA